MKKILIFIIIVLLSLIILNYLNYIDLNDLLSMIGIESVKYKEFPNPKDFVPESVISEIRLPQRNDPDLLTKFLKIVDLKNPFVLCVVIVDIFLFFYILLYV